MPSIWTGPVPSPYYHNSTSNAILHSPMDSHSSSSVSKPKKRPITRNRETLACLACRARKLKCDRGQPCGTCVKRGEPDTCAYGRPSGGDEPSERGRISQGEIRLQHLERLVEDFIRGKSTQERERSRGPSNAMRDDYSSMDSRMTETGRFIGSTHYSAMLDDIQELRDILGMASDSYDEMPALGEQGIDEFSILFGGVPCPTLSTVISRYLPPRPEVDRRVVAYFRSPAVAAPYVHVPQFHRQYAEFWNDQLNTSPLWISMLFSICQISKGLSTEPPFDDPSDRDFSVAAAYCLALGHYHRPQRFTVESLLMYVHCNISSRMDLPRDVGTLFATLIRLAYTMGYHRDPDHFSHLNAFEGEMRRRTWAICIQLDLLISFQLGLPTSVQPESWDTREISNLLDSDLDEHARVLPPTRAPTEPTQAMFYAAKQQLMTGFPRVLKHALSGNGHPAKNDDDNNDPEDELELLAVDAELRASYAAIPPALHMPEGEISASLGDPVYVIVTRRCLELLYQKCLCVLHRRYVTVGREGSIRVCLEAASAIVRSMLEVYPEVQPGGRLWADRWMAFGALTWNDFLLGLMVLCLILRQHRRSPVEWFEKTETSDVVGGIVERLRAGRVICVEKAAQSRESRRIVRLLDAVLGDSISSSALHPALAPTTGAGAGAAATSQISSSFSGEEQAEEMAQLSDMEGVVTSEASADFPSFDFEGQLWNPQEANLFNMEDWGFLEESFDENFR